MRCSECIYEKLCNKLHINNGSVICDELLLIKKEFKSKKARGLKISCDKCVYTKICYRLYFDRGSVNCTELKLIEKKGTIK